MTLTHSRPSQARVYAVNYNVLRIMSGISGLAIHLNFTKKL